MIDYPHVMARLFNAPLMLDPGKAGMIFRALGPRLGLGEWVEMRQPPGVRVLPDMYPADSTIPGSIDGGRDRPYYITTDGVAVLTIRGSLAHSAAGAMPPSGMTSYTRLRADLRSAAQDGQVRGVLLNFSTAGGEASDSAFALADEIRVLANAKPVWAVADEMALSAGYLLAAQASRLLVPQSGALGSIGVLALHVDETESDRMAGLQYNFIYAGAEKIAGTSHLPLDAGTRARIQAQVDATYQRFLDAVAAGRPRLGLNRARETEARVYTGREAVALGLADGVMDFRQALAAFTASLRGAVIRPSAAPNHVFPQPAATAAVTHQQEPTMNTIPTEAPAAIAAADPGAAAAPATASAAAPAAQPSQDAVTVAVAAERRRIADLQALALPGTEQLLKDAIANGMSAGDFAQALIRAEKAKAATVMLGLAAEQTAVAVTPVASGISGMQPGSVNVENLPVEQKAKIEWEQKPALRAEFQNDLASYIAFVKAEENGQARRLVRT